MNYYYNITGMFINILDLLILFYYVKVLVYSLILLYYSKSISIFIFNMCFAFNK